MTIEEIKPEFLHESLVISILGLYEGMKSNQLWQTQQEKNKGRHGNAVFILKFITSVTC